MDAEKLLETLRGDHMERLRHELMRKAGIPPFSLRAALISDRQVIRYACHLVLDGQGADTHGSFDMERFLRMKEGENGGI